MSEIFEAHCEQGCTIYHDGWAAYNSVDYEALGLSHQENVTIKRNGSRVRHMRDQCFIEQVWN